MPNVNVTYSTPNSVEVATQTNTVTIVQPEGSSVTVNQTGTQTVEITAPGPQGPAGQIPNTGSFATTGSNTFNGNQIISGSLNITTGITGSLKGTGSWAQSASVALYALSTPFQPTNAGGNSREIQFNENNTFGARSTFIFNYDVTQSLQQGDNVQALGQYSHAEGSDSITYGNVSHAEGKGTQAIGFASHAEGSGSLAGWLGYNATNNEKQNGEIIINYTTYGDILSLFTAGTFILLDDTEYGNVNGIIKLEVASIRISGSELIAITLVDTNKVIPSNCVIGIVNNPTPLNADVVRGIGSHTEGLGTIASANFQHVQGQYNKPTGGQSAFIIGNGADDANRSNLLFASGSKVQITGSVQISGSLNITGTTNILPYKIYTALLNQTSTNPPTASILQDDFNNNFTYGYGETGVYTLNSTSNFFTINKTFVLLGNTHVSNPGEIVNFQVLNTGNIRLFTSYNTDLSDNILVNTPIEIRVYN